MLKFLRRLFIVLILLLVVFVVYRYINPDGASRLVDKIKSIPASIGIGVKDKIEIESETTSLSGDIKDDIDTKQTQEEDLWRLESLNKEIEDILWKDKSEVFVDEDILTDVHIEIEDLPVVEIDESLEPISNTWVDNIDTWDSFDTWTDFTIWKQEDTWEQKNVWNLETKIEDNKKPQAVQTTTKKTNSLSNFDYQQILNVFGNLFK